MIRQPSCLNTSECGTLRSFSTIRSVFFARGTPWAMLVVLVCVLMQPGSLAQAPPQGTEKKDKTSKILVRLIHLDDGDIPRPFQLIQMNSDGVFITSEGAPITNEALSSLFTVTDKEKPERPVIVVDLLNEKETPLSVFLSATDRLKQAGPPNKEAWVFIRYSVKRNADKEK